MKINRVVEILKKRAEYLTAKCEKKSPGEWTGHESWCIAEACALDVTIQLIEVESRARLAAGQLCNIPVRNERVRALKRLSPCNHGVPPNPRSQYEAV